MDVSEKLDALRAEVSGCSLVAFSDLESKLVLATSAAFKPAQEDLDNLSDLAQAMLNGSVAKGGEATLDGEAGVAMLISGGDTKVFLRAPGEAVEGLVCVCAPDADLRAMVDQARSTLSAIASAS